MAKRQDNLIPLTEQPPDVAHELRVKGGKARVRQRNERKTMREWAIALGDIPVTIKTPDGKATDTTTLGAIVAAQMAQATKGNTQAAKFIADLLGEMVQQVAVKADQPLVVTAEEMASLDKWAKKK